MLLQTKELAVHFGGIKALDGVDLAVDRGEVVGLIGPNGAGKTTFIDAVTGFVPHRGAVLLDGLDIAHQPAYKRAGRGVVRTFQQLELYNDLSVMENLLVSARGSRSERHERIHGLIDRYGLHEVEDDFPEDLSHGRQRLVSLARALASDPRLVLLDEPAAGLDSKESLGLADPVRALAGDGVGVLLIDHDVDLVLSVCDRVYVLDFGKVIFEGPAADINGSDAVRAAYLGVPA
ncbi:ABC transporter ATP-binding protein [Actinomadura geliboluensis]|uniref:ABC transporter ATP-binding protein n=1 Tax=Actinomadura geliboluensis TaxID=882440 RepID=UPI00371F797E